MASMWTLVIKNNSGGDVTVEDLGITIADTTQITFSDQFTYEELATSDDLRGYVDDGTLVANNGSVDLTKSEGREHLTISHHFYNYGIDYWAKPCNFRVVDIVTDAAAVAALTGMSAKDVVVQEDTANYLEYDGAAWNVLQSVDDEDRVINLADANESIFEYNDSEWENQGDPGANTRTVAVMVADTRASGREKFWTYSVELNVWRTQILGTLDDAYNEGDENDDHTIIVDDGPVVFDATTGDTAPITLTELSSFPTTVTDGDIVNVGSELYVYDATRGKWLSGQKDPFVFGRRGSSKDQYLGFFGGQLASNNSGLRLPQNAVIVSMTVQLDASGTCDVHIRKNDAAANIATLSVAAATGATDNTLNVDVAADDFLQCYVEATTAVADPMVIVKLAYTS